MPSTQVLVCTSKDDRASGWLRAQALVADLREHYNVNARLVVKSGFDLGDLHLIARYRVVATPAVVLVRDDVEVGRILGIPTARTVHTMVQVTDG
jgi:DNA-binding transcriptional regulator LsrR (DeoR family)